MGKYEAVDDDISTLSSGNTDGLVRRRHWYGARFQMGMLVLAGFLTMICHHFLYRRLDGTTVNTNPILGLKLSQQVIVSAAGNAIASFATFVLGMAISIAFVQILWTRLRRKSYPIEHIDAMISCRSSPFSPAALRAWRAAWLLSAIAGLGSGMRLITIFAPGALRTADSTFTSIWEVPMVEVSGVNYGLQWHDENVYNDVHPSPMLLRMTMQNLISGSYISPPNYSGATLQYNTSFNSPAINCTSITRQYDFTRMFPESEEPIIYNATHNVNDRGSHIIVATVEAANTAMEAASCIVYNATYSVEIHHYTNASTNVLVRDIDYYKPMAELQRGDSGYDSIFAVALATAETLVGVGQVNMSTMESLVNPKDSFYNNPYIIFSAMGQPGPPNTKRWKWNRSMVDAIPELMTNISISLLSNPMNASLSYENTPCINFNVVYSYDRLHLLLSYGSGILVALICVAAGFWSIERNEHQEETLEFSRLLDAILSPDLLHEELRKDVRLKVQQVKPGGCAKFSVDFQDDHGL